MGVKIGCQVPLDIFGDHFVTSSIASDLERVSPAAASADIASPLGNTVEPLVEN
jgi:hypothetical protein